MCFLNVMILFIIYVNVNLMNLEFIFKCNDFLI